MKTRISKRVANEEYMKRVLESRGGSAVTLIMDGDGEVKKTRYETPLVWATLEVKNDGDRFSVAYGLCTGGRGQPRKYLVRGENYYRLEASARKFVDEWVCPAGTAMGAVAP